MTNKQFRIESNVRVHGVSFAVKAEEKRLLRLKMNPIAAERLALSNVEAVIGYVIR